MSSLWWIVFAVFALALLAGFIRKLRKDPCLKFLHASHVTFLGAEGRTMWGDMQLTSQGLELCFDAPHVDRRDLSKNGAILFPPELSNMLALCRTVHGMSDRERALRERRVHAVLEPTRSSRLARNLRNLGGMLRDALMDTISLLLGQLSSSKRKPVAALADQQKHVSDVGGAILDLGARAYEPLLERHIGKPVILQIGGAVQKTKLLEFPGYLAEYNEKYIVIVNASHAPEESMSIRAGEADPDACASVERRGERLEITCSSEDAVVVKRLVGATSSFDIGAALLPGSRLSMHLPAEFEFQHAEVDRTRRLDFVCPRAQAQIRYSSTVPPIRRSSWTGMSPG